MGLWQEQVVPRVVNKTLDVEEVHPLRRRACGALSGHVLEIGFGSGLNVGFYGPDVERVTAVEPSDVGWRLAEQRIAAATVPVQRSGLDGQRLPFPDDSFDAALSTFTLCTIPDAGAALREVRRVLRPGASLHFVEHGLAPDEGVRRWQSRLEPVNRRIAGGCHLSRPIDALVREAGLTLVRLDRSYLPKAPRPFASIYEGVARA